MFNAFTGVGAAVLALCFISVTASAQHAGDALFAIEEGVLVTGAIGEDASIELGERVFVGAFGDSGFPGFTANPGFDALVGTFPPQTKIGFDILEPLQVWTGDGFDVAAEETLTVSFLTFEATTGGGLVPGFELFVAANGSFHRHYSMFVEGPGGAPAAPGVYLLVRGFYSTAEGIAPSAPVHFVLGHEVDPLITAAAAEWLRESLEAPTSCLGDLDGNGTVDGGDLGVLLGAWGTGAEGSDLDGNGIVDGADLGILLGAWGVCSGALAASLPPAGLAVADEEHFDVWLRVVESTRGTFVIETGSITEGDPGDPLAENWRVFPAELGEDPQFPFSAVEPGFQLLASPETQNQVLVFSIVSPVLRWTGAAFVADGSTMEFAFGPESASSGDGPEPGFQFAANAQGSIHDHFDQTLIGPAGTDPAPGIYIIGLSMAGVTPVLGASLPFYYCYNLGLDEEDHEAACEYADLYVACTLDLDGDGVVDGADLGILLGNFDKRGDGGGIGDLNRDGIVNGADLGLLLAGWGHVCPTY